MRNQFLVTFHGQVFILTKTEHRDKIGNYITVNSMLPVIDHVVNDAAFQCHSLCISQDYTSYLNPGQTTVSEVQINHCLH